ncbi:MAG: cytochrome c biogenesis protein DipZ [Asticcacaulis sp.]|uniref:cytochrome c biogenesis protein DipZ n=1 Tax=Asticcacaulis sp. TaxID=1872648 RepID=UPI0039E6D9FF
MILFILAYLGGALTIVSPCILPVLPFVFARADQPFVKSGLPLLLGLTLTFAGVATLAAIGGGWAVQASGIGRIVALVILAGFGLLLLFPALADRATRPLVALGARLTETTSGQSGFATSLLLGIATGLLWAPCAGPILGLVLTGAALNGASVSTTFLLLAYALGAATSLALALLVGGKVFTAMKGSLKLGETVRKALGVAVLLGVAAIASGLDTGLLSKISLAGTSRIEQALLDKFSAQKPMARAVGLPEGPLPVLGQMPELDGAGLWLNSKPLTRESLKGKVVVVDFWTYSCINCLRTLPYVKAWDAKYRDQGLVVIGIHTPEFAFEKDERNVRKALKDLGITYPVATDNDFKVWKAFNNQYWPQHYFIDAKGQIRHIHHGEGGYAESEQVIQRLLAEAHGQVFMGQPYVPSISTVSGSGVEAAAGGDVKTPETYVGYRRAAQFTSPGGFVKDAPHEYARGTANLNDWSLSGDWTVGGQMAVVNKPNAGITYRFHARDLHLVLGAGDKPVRFRVTIDGHAPGKDHGADTDANGMGVITDHRLYQLIRQEKAADRTFQIEFLDSGAQAYAFTFG